MADNFEDHCWKDIVSPDILEIYSHYERTTLVGPSPALIAIDLYELSYQGGAKPVIELAKTYPSSCGENAFAAIEPTKKLFAAARGAALPSKPNSSRCPATSSLPNSAPAPFSAPRWSHT
jgi:maleamate amidohydrolase